jgi:hypothetical protein
MPPALSTAEKHLEGSIRRRSDAISPAFIVLNTKPMLPTWAASFSGPLFRAPAWSPEGTRLRLQPMPAGDCGCVCCVCASVCVCVCGVGVCVLWVCPCGCPCGCGGGGNRPNPTGRQPGPTTGIPSRHGPWRVTEPTTSSRGARAQAGRAEMTWMAPPKFKRRHVRACVCQCVPLSVCVCVCVLGGGGSLAESEAHGPIPLRLMLALRLPGTSESEPRVLAVIALAIHCQCAVSAHTTVTPPEGNASKA